MSQRLPRDQEIVGSDRFAGSFQLSTNPSGNLSIAFLEGKHNQRPRQEDGQALRIHCLSSTLVYPVPKLKQDDGRDAHRRLCLQGGIQSVPDPCRFTVDQRNAGVGVQQVIHSKILRTGVAG